MKRSFLFLAVVFAVVAGLICFTSCEKDPANPENPTDSTEVNDNNSDNPGDNPAGDFDDLTVSTNTSKRNAIIEEYTGIYCGYCPDGHAIVRELMENNPNKVFAINIHQGYYANDTYTTEWGDALAAQTGLTGYPSGTVNRHVFSGTMAMDRSKWDTRAKQIIAKTSSLNLAARAIIDTNARTMKVCVKGYYTSDSDSSTNLLNVAVLQNDIVGQQSNYGNYNQAQYDAQGRYHHMHMLRDLITGQWGELIETTTRGTSFERTYDYAIPAKISKETVVLKDLEIIVFVTLTHADIETGVRAEILYK